MIAKCPSCGFELQAGQRFCSVCGFDIATGRPSEQAGQPSPPTAPPISGFPGGSSAPGVYQNPIAPNYPYSSLAGRSVVQALLPANKATSAFWVGLFMLLVGLFLVACPFMVGLAVALGQGDQPQSQLVVGSLGISGCAALLLLLPGAALVAVGRPRPRLMQSRK